MQRLSKNFALNTRDLQSSGTYLTRIVSVIGICPNTKLIAAIERKNKDKFSYCEARYIKITCPIDIQNKTRRGEILSMSHPIATWAKDAHAYTIPAKIPVIATFVERDARLISKYLGNRKLMAPNKKPPDAVDSARAMRACCQLGVKPELLLIFLFLLWF